MWPLPPWLRERYDSFFTFFFFLFLSSLKKIKGERVGTPNVGADWEIVKLTLTFSQADASAKSFVPQPSFVPFFIVFFFFLFLSSFKRSEGIPNVGADWEIAKLTLTFNQADASAKSFGPQPSFVSFFILLFFFLFLSSFQEN